MNGGVVHVGPDSFAPQLGKDLVACLLYTSDAADERSSVDLGGRRIIKKKNTVAPDGGGTCTTTDADRAEIQTSMQTTTEKTV